MMRPLSLRLSGHTQAASVMGTGELEQRGIAEVHAVIAAIEVQRVLAQLTRHPERTVQQRPGEIVARGIGRGGAAAFLEPVDTPATRRR